MDPATPKKNVSKSMKVLWKHKTINPFSFNVISSYLFEQAKPPNCVYFLQEVIAVIWVCLSSPIRSQIFVGFSVARSATQELVVHAFELFTAC
jgi:hypothetical protein